LHINKKNFLLLSEKYILLKEICVYTIYLCIYIYIYLFILIAHFIYVQFMYKERRIFEMKNARQIFLLLHLDILKE